MMPRWETVGEVHRLGHNRFEWKVDESYFLNPQVGCYVGSPTFHYENSFWYFTKWPYGWASPLVYNWIGLSLCGTSSQGPALSVRLGIRRIDGRDLKSSRGLTSPYGSFEQPRYLRTWQVHKRISEISINGRVTVFCEVNIEDGSAEAMPFPREGANEREGVEEHRYNPDETDELPLSEEEEEVGNEESDAKAKALKSESFDRLLRDLKALWLNEEDNDISFNVQGTELSAHKLILGARCPVFHSMFKHEMAEQASGVVEINDCDPDSFRDFLHYIYTGSVENMSENAFNLFSAADKYCLDELRSECLEFIRTNLCVDTFCPTMMLSLRYSETELLEQTTKFFAKHMKEIIVIKSWETFLRENTAEGNKLFIKALIPEE